MVVEPSNWYWFVDGLSDDWALPETKINAVLLYLSGVSMNRIAFLLRVSAQAVLTWIRAFASTRRNLSLRRE